MKFFDLVKDTEGVYFVDCNALTRRFSLKWLMRLPENPIQNIKLNHYPPLCISVLNAPYQAQK